jgi:apolipoprotein N-acyltransferase
VAVLQPNINQDIKWDPVYRNETMRILFDLSYQAKSEGAQLIVWPETATPFYLLEDAMERDMVETVVNDMNVALITGTVYREPRPQPLRGRDYSRYNAAVLMLPREGVVAKYAKIRLVPFGEHIPWEADVPAVMNALFEDSGDFTPGWGWDVWRGPGYDVGCFICFEIIFPDVSRAYTLKGADFLVNCTNEGWFGKTNEPYQALAAAVFRAVENRSWLVRAANTGVTCFIDPNGRVVRKSKIYLRNQLTDYVYPRRYLTFYTRHGDWFARLLAFVAAAVLVWTAAGAARSFWVSRRGRGGNQ